MEKSRSNSSMDAMYYGLSETDIKCISELVCPVPENEVERLMTLRETGLLDSNPADPIFDRYTSLCKRIFEVDLDQI
jgi:hypothetical protein